MSDPANPGVAVEQTVPHGTTSRATANELTTFSLTPSTLKEAMEFSKIIAESDLVPKDYKNKPGNVLVAVQMGLELGLKPLQAIQGIAIINGRPSVWGDALLALVRASPHFESIEEEQTETEAVCRVKRRGEAAITRSFSMADATKAGLANKEGPWRQYPRRMLQMRARAFALRDAFADVLKGISMAEEARDIQDDSRDIEGTTVDDLNSKLRALDSAKRELDRPETARPAPDIDWFAELHKLKTDQEIKEWYRGTAERRKALTPEALTALDELVAKRRRAVSAAKAGTAPLPAQD